MTSNTLVANNTMELTSYLNGFGDLQQQVNTGTLADDITRLLRNGSVQGQVERPSLHQQITNAVVAGIRQPTPTLAPPPTPPVQQFMHCQQPILGNNGQGLNQPNNCFQGYPTGSPFGQLGMMRTNMQMHHHPFNTEL